jgi:hypothetical protein
MNHQCVFIERASAVVMAEKSRSRRNRHLGRRTAAHQPLAPIQNRGIGAAPLNEFGGVRLDLVLPASAPNDQAQIGFRCTAERHWWTRFRFHRREEREDRLGALISLASASIAPYRAVARARVSLGRLGGSAAPLPARSARYIRRGRSRPARRRGQGLDPACALARRGLVRDQPWIGEHSRLRDEGTTARDAFLTLAGAVC